MKSVFIYSLLAIVVLSCDKDSFETKPSLEYKTANTEIVPVNGELRVEVSYTDKEGDLDSVFLIRHRLNRKNPVVMPALKAPDLVIPKDFKNDPRGDLVFILEYQRHLIAGINPIQIPGTGGKLEPDTLELKFILKDKALNTSDTARKTFIIIR